MRDKLEDAFLRLRAAAHADEYVPMEDVIEFVLKLSEAGRAALAKLAERDALCEQQTRTIALTSERAVKAETDDFQMNETRCFCWYAD